MSTVRNVVHWAAIGASGLVILGFVFFAVDEASATKQQQIARVDDEDAPAPAETTREQDNGPVREIVADANDVLLRPFEGVVDSDDGWVKHGVPALLAVLCYGFGLVLLFNYVAPARR